MASNRPQLQISSLSVLCSLINPSLWLFFAQNSQIAQLYPYFCLQLLYLRAYSLTSLQISYCIVIDNKFLLEYYKLCYMIQKNSISSSPNQQQIELLIEITCEQCFGYFVENTCLQRSNFPILELTYTMWRAFSFERVKKILKQNNRVIKKQHKQLFYKISEQKFLPKFIERINNQMNLYCRGLKDVEQQLKEVEKLPKEEEQIYNLIIQMGKKVWEQQLNLQKIEDLMHLPYLNIVPLNQKLNSRIQFDTGYFANQKKTSKLNQMANNAGKSIFNKILTTFTTTIFSKAFIFKINTLFGSFNPLVIGASLGLNQYLKHLDKKKKDQNLQYQLRSALKIATNKVQMLNKIYSECLQQIQKIIGLTDQSVSQKEQIEKLKQKFYIVFQKQWLHIKITPGEDGWQIVQLDEKESFEQLQNQNNSKPELAE